MFQRVPRWDAEAAGSSHLMGVVMGRWSEQRSSPTIHSVPVDQALLTAVMSGLVRPPVPLFTHVAVQSLRMLAFWERNQSYQFAALVCRLVLVPQWGMCVEVASG